MKKRMAIAIICLVVVFGGLIGYNLFKEHMMAEYFKTFKMPPVTISTVKAKTEDWLPTISSVGSFTAVNGVDVNAQQSGHVTKIDFESGQYVKKNKLLIEIDHSIDEASLAEAKATLTLSQLNFKRQNKLLRQNATSASDLDTARSTLQQDQAAVDKIEATIAQKMIRAPFDGKLGVRLVNLGQYITAGSTTVVSLQSQDPLFLQFYLPEHYLPKINTGQEVLFHVTGFDEGVFKGKVQAINSKVETGTHNILIQATLANCPLISEETKALIQTDKEPTSGIKVQTCNTEANAKAGVTKFKFTPGMFASIEVLLPKLKNKLVLPTSAISYSLYGNSVYVVNKVTDKTTGKDSLKVFQKFVKTGPKRGNRVVVLSGIKPGDEVVNSGQLKLQNGTDVIVNNKIKMDTAKDIDTLGE